METAENSHEEREYHRSSEEIQVIVHTHALFIVSLEPLSCFCSKDAFLIHLF
jgi:hypothetical protein